MDDNEITDATSPHSSDTFNGGLGDGAQAVKVAVHIRPLIGTEVFQGCKDCVTVAPGEPQVHIGSHSFTFDHVYGSTASPSSNIFEECVSPLVEGLFQGYNATVLAYGQTGSGKTYTMGTAYTVGGSTEGIIPKVMELIFNKVTAFKEKAEFQIRVSFIEILKEEVHDLLDPNPPIAIKSDTSNSFGSKAVAPGKVIQIRENTSGEITLAGVTEIGVCSLEEMAACLEQGSLCRATASTNMNTRSSRSHAIFTITLEQKRLLDSSANGTNNTSCDDMSDDFLCAKLHLVDLAGSERAKRTGADGVRFKEGVHINKGLLALGNVISALGDDKKRKEGGHVPYRDSKLTRLLQDSLGGNSRTVMLACISPADSNAEETLNTLKYANRARNIQNKPVVNRDPMAAEMQRMRQQVDLLQAELLCIKAGGSFEEVQILKQRIAWLETSLLEMQQELRVARDNLHQRAQRLVETEAERDKLQLKIEMFRDGKTWEDVMSDGAELQSAALLESYAQRIKVLEDEVQNLRDITPQASGFGQHTRTGSALDIDALSLSLTEGAEATQLEEETVAKEMEHARLQDSLDKELEELNKRLEQKEAEMKTFSKCDGVVLKPINRKFSCRRKPYCVADLSSEQFDCVTEYSIMSSQQFQREEESRGYTPQQADASPQLGSGTDVMGEPVNPLSESAPSHTRTSHTAVDPAASGRRASQASVDPTAAGSRDPPVSPMYDSQTPANATGYSRTPTGNFPSAQMPQSFSSGQTHAGGASQLPTAQTTSHSPYVQTTSVPGSTGKTPMDSIMSVFNKWSKKAEDMGGNYWGHLRTGPNVADTAMGRIALGTRAFSEGGLENVYRQTFEVEPEEHLLKTYACYLSTSTGPVAGTLYISNHKLAFCSDRPLAIPQPPGQSDATNQPAASDASTPTCKKSSAEQHAQQQHQYCYYKVTVPISQVESVNPSENTQKKPPEKYVQVKTSDGHEFWFLGFVNYDKGVKNLQEAVLSKNATSPTNNTASYGDANTTTNPPSYGDTNPTTNPPSYGDASYVNPTAKAPAYGDTSYGNAGRPTTNPPSHHDTSYATDTRGYTGPPSYDDVNPTTNPPSHVNSASHV